jgi:hypothetical protein
MRALVTLYRTRSAWAAAAGYLWNHILGTEFSKRYLAGERQGVAAGPAGPPSSHPTGPPAPSSPSGLRRSLRSPEAGGSRG